MKTGMFKKLENLMVAVTFAEKNQMDTASTFLNVNKKKQVRHFNKKKLTNHTENRPQMRL